MSKAIKIGGLRDLKVAIRHLTDLVARAEKAGPDAYGGVCLYGQKDLHAGINVEWIKLVLLAASMQLAALQRASEPQQ